MDFVKKWFWEYKAWTWTAIAIVLILIFGLVMLVSWLSGSTGAGGYGFLLVIALAVTLIYTAVMKEKPPQWFMVWSIAIPLFLWGFQAIAPSWSAEWHSSAIFGWMIAASIALAWLTQHKALPVAGIARTGLIVLMVLAILTGAFGKARAFVATQSTVAATTRTLPARVRAKQSQTPVAAAIPGVNAMGRKTFTVSAGQEYVIYVPEGSQWRLIDPPLPGSTWTTFDRGRDQDGYRVQVFTTVGDADSVTLTNVIEPCSSCEWTRAK